MAEDVAAGSPARRVVAPPSRTERARASAYYFRFTLAYALLTMLAVGGVGALVLVLLQHDAAPKPAWSTFKPTGSSVAMAKPSSFFACSSLTANPFCRARATVICGRELL